MSPMTDTEMLALVARLDEKVNDLLLAGADDTGLFVGMIDHMPEFKRLLDSPHAGELETLAKRYPGFGRYARVLTGIAQGIADGSIRAPR